MGFAQSKNPLILPSQGGATPTPAVSATPTASVQSNPNWQALVNHAFEKPANSEAIILFTRTPISNPSDLVGKNIIDVAKAAGAKDNAAAFAVGQGPCPSCDKPTLFWWNGNAKAWANNVIPDTASILRAVDGYVLQQGLNNIYHLYGDKKLIITSVARTAKVSNGDITVSDGSAVKSKNLQETMTSSGAILFWIILIILIIVILWLLFRKKH